MYYILMSSIVLVMLVYIIFSMVFYKKMMEGELISCYECGFDPHSLTRVVFSYRFFLIAILFIIFDVEISLMLPVPFMMSSEVMLWVFSLFIIILLIGLIYEYYCGSLEWLIRN